MGRKEIGGIDAVVDEGNAPVPAGVVLTQVECVRLTGRSRLPVAGEAPHPGETGGRSEGHEREEDIEAVREMAAEVELRAFRQLEVDRDDGRFRHPRALAGDECHPVPGRREASRKVDDHALGAAVRRGREAVPEEQGNVHRPTNLPSTLPIFPADDAPRPADSPSRWRRGFRHLHTASLRRTPARRRGGAARLSARL